MPGRNSISLLLVLAAGLLAGLAGCGSSDDGISLSAGEPELVSVAQLSEFADDAGTPIYWLGERAGNRYELTETASGRIYVRYLREGAKAGDPSSGFVTVATYPSQGGIANLRRSAQAEEDALVGHAPDGAALLGNPSSSSVYLAYPGDDAQVEVYDPDPGQALRLASAGAVRAVP